MDDKTKAIVMLDGYKVDCLTKDQMGEIMVLFHKKLSETPDYTPHNFMGGFHIDFREHRLGSTKGRAILLLHPDDYKRVLNIEDEPI